MIWRRFFLPLAAAILALSLSACRSTQAEYSQTLSGLRAALQERLQDQDQVQRKFLEEYAGAHDQLTLAIDRSENLPMLLYSQNPDYTLNLCRILRELDREHRRFTRKSATFDRVTRNLDIETERYGRLIASLQQRPVEPGMEACRDSCISYASRIRDSYAGIREALSADWQLYQQAVRHASQTQDYAQTRIAQLGDYVFKEGQTSWPRILAHPGYYADRLRQTLQAADEEHVRLDQLSGTFRRSTLLMILNFLALLALILAAVRMRAGASGLKAGIRLCLPAIFMALVVTVCRVGFMPDRLITLILAPTLLLACLWQLTACIRCSGKVDGLDRALGWAALAVGVAALTAAFLGYTFAAMVLIVWWYVQLAVIQAIQCLVHLIRRYKETKVIPRLEASDERIADATGLKKQALQFGITWFYDLVAGVLLPVAGVLSVPFCIRLALGAFDFSAIFRQLYTEPFLNLHDNNGGDVLRLSFQGIILLVCLFFVFRYVNKLVRGLWQNISFAASRRKTHHEKVNSNDINLALGNTIINVLVWLLYVVIAVVTLRIPIGSLGLIAGGFSAGVGLALKEPIHNFICGIQLMAGRMHVGDYIECDGVRGKVKSIGFQNTVVQVFDDDSYIVFLNSTLFEKNFKNLSRNSAYDYVKIPVSVRFGTDVEKARSLLVEAAKALQTKDRFGRDIVEPGFGVRVVVDNFGERNVDIGLAQYVLIEEQIDYIYKAKELIYRTLAQNVITPNLKYDVKIVQED